MSKDLVTIRDELAPRLDQNAAAVYLASLESPASRVTMRQALGVVAVILTNQPDPFTVPWGELRFQHVIAIRSKLIERYSPASCNKILCAVRKTLAAAYRLGQLGADDYHRATDIENVKGSGLPAGRDVDHGEIIALVRACESDHSPAGARDAGILAVTCPPSGLRRAEVVTLDLDDFEPESGRLVVRGKRRKTRAIYLEQGARQAVMDWLQVRGDLPGPLFLPVNKAGVIGDHRLTTQAIYNMMRRRAILARVKPFSPHDLRRSTVGELLDQGVDVVTVAAILGHASVSTTQRYDRRPERVRQLAATKVHFPYRGRS